MNEQIKMEVPYFQVPNKIFEVGLTNYELVTYMYLARCGNHGSTAFPSYNTIANKCGMSRRKAIDTVKSLIEKKLLYKQYRYNEVAGENYSNIYVVNHEISGAQNALGNECGALGSELDTPNKELGNKELNIKIIKGICSDKQNSYNYFGVLDYFLEAYTWYIGKEHPVLKKKQWINVMENLFTVEIDNMSSDVSEEDEMDMMKKYLLTDFKTEHNILHYISGDIRKLRYFECGLL